MRSNSRNIFILFFTLVVVMLGFGMIIPILPFYIDAFGASGSELGFLMAIFATMQFIFSPIWGQVSDRVGRKPILLIGVVGNAISMLFFGLSTQLWMAYASRALAGILSSATMPTAMAYIGDSTSQDDRGKGMGFMGAAMGLGMVIGPGLGGVLAKGSLSMPFFIAAGLSMLAFILIMLVLPESLPIENRAQGSQKIRGLQLDVMWKALFSPIGILLVLAFLVSFGLTNFEGVFGLYALKRFAYGPDKVGSLLTIIGLVSAIVQGALTGPATKRFGEVAVIRFSLIGSVLGFGVMLLAYNYPTVALTVGLFILSNAMLRPAISSLTSQRATLGQGVAMGLNNSFMSLGRIAGPITAGFLFDLNIIFPYLAGAIVMLIGFLVSVIWLGNETPNSSPETEIIS